MMACMWEAQRRMNSTTCNTIVVLSAGVASGRWPSVGLEWSEEPGDPDKVIAGKGGAQVTF